MCQFEVTRCIKTDEKVENVPEDIRASKAGDDADFLQERFRLDFCDNS